LEAKKQKPIFAQTFVQTLNLTQNTPSMNKRNKIVVVGSSNTDIVISTEHFPKPGETVMGHDFLTNHGGKGANQAVAASRLGGDVAFVGKVGKDSFGNSTLEMLKKEGVDITYVTRTNKMPSGMAFITIDSNAENTIIVNPGANDLLSEEDIERAGPVIKKAQIMLLQLETPVKSLIRAAEIAKANDVFVVLNPAPYSKKTRLPKELLRNVDLLIPNETEAMGISGVETFDDTTASVVMEKIREIGIKNIVITMGARGVMAYQGDKIITVEACKVKAVDTTAAGDTFCGALCVSLCKGIEMRESLKFANKASSITVTRRGAQISMPYINEVK